MDGEKGKRGRDLERLGKVTVLTDKCIATNTAIIVTQETRACRRRRLVQFLDESFPLVERRNHGDKIMRILKFEPLPGSRAVRSKMPSAESLKCIVSKMLSLSNTESLKC